MVAAAYAQKQQQLNQEETILEASNQQKTQQQQQSTVPSNQAQAQKNSGVNPSSGAVPFEAQLNSAYNANPSQPGHVTSSNPITNNSTIVVKSGSITAPSLGKGQTSAGALASYGEANGVGSGGVYLNSTYYSKGTFGNQWLDSKFNTVTNPSLIAELNYLYNGTPAATGAYLINTPAGGSAASALSNVVIGGSSGLMALKNPQTGIGNVEIVGPSTKYTYLAIDFDTLNKSTNIPMETPSFQIVTSGYYNTQTGMAELINPFGGFTFNQLASMYGYQAAVNVTSHPLTGSGYLGSVVPFTSTDISLINGINQNISAHEAAYQLLMNAPKTAASILYGNIPVTGNPGSTLTINASKYIGPVASMDVHSSLASTLGNSIVNYPTIMYRAGGSLTDYIFKTAVAPIENYMNTPGNLPIYNYNEKQAMEGGLEFAASIPGGILQLGGGISILSFTATKNGPGAAGAMASAYIWRYIAGTEQAFQQNPVKTGVITALNILTIADIAHGGISDPKGFADYLLNDNTGTIMQKTMDSRPEVDLRPIVDLSKLDDAAMRADQGHVSYNAYTRMTDSSDSPLYRMLDEMHAKGVMPEEIPLPYFDHDMSNFFTMMDEESHIPVPPYDMMPEPGHDVPDISQHLIIIDGRIMVLPGQPELSRIDDLIKTLNIPDVVTMSSQKYAPDTIQDTLLNLRSVSVSVSEPQNDYEQDKSGIPSVYSTFSDISNSMEGISFIKEKNDTDDLYSDLADILNPPKKRRTKHQRASRLFSISLPNEDVIFGNIKGFGGL